MKKPYWTIHRAYEAQRWTFTLGMLPLVLLFAWLKSLLPGNGGILLGTFGAGVLFFLEAELFLYFGRLAYRLEDSHIETLRVDTDSTFFEEVFYPTTRLESNRPGRFYTWKSALSRPYRRKVYVPQNHRNYCQRPSGKRQKRRTW